MAKKQFKKVLSMGLSLVMCASLTVPAFAATFGELQEAIDGTGGTAGEHAVYGQNNDIHAWTGDDGFRNVQLQGNVTNSGNEGSITIDGGKKVNLDLNGKNIDNNETHSGQSTIWVNGGELTLNDSHTGDEAGQITGGTGSGIWVDSGSKLTMNGGKISNNTSKNDGGGGVNVCGEFIMTGGTISDNKTASGQIHGGGVRVNKNATFTMTGGTITGNTADAQGGGVHVHEGTFAMNGGTIKNNTANYGGGVNTWNGTIAMTNGTISGNHANKDGSDVWVKAENGGSARFTMSGKSAINGGNSEQENGKHVVGVEGNSAFTMNGNASLTHSNIAKADIFVKGEGATVSYRRDDEGGLRDVPTPDTDPDNEEADLPKTAVGTTEGKSVNIAYPPEPAPSEEPENPGDETGDGTVIEDPDVPLADEPEVEIDEPAVPLASGPITRAEFIDYLWRHEGEPASDGVCTFTDVEDTHQFFEALCWADENGVAEAYFNAPGHEDGTFEPDELVTVGAAREFLTNFENVFGRQAVAAASLKSLTGADDEAVLNCDEVLAEFFGEAYVPAKEDDVEIAA